MEVIRIAIRNFSRISWSCYKKVEAIQLRRRLLKIVGIKCKGFCLVKLRAKPLVAKTPSLRLRKNVSIFGVSYKDPNSREKSLAK
jgi:hypothetical protein